MKHKPKIVAVLIAMFLVTQLIGLYVVNHYSSERIVNGEYTNVSAPDLPLGLEPPEIQQEKDFWSTYFPSLIFAFVVAISLFFLLARFKAEIVIRVWFTIVVVLALVISISSFLPQFKYAIIIALVLAAVLTFFKIYRRSFLIHNITELLIYPGIAAIFVALLTSPQNPNRGVYAISALLVLISIYDIWAVWHSGIMQKMAKFQMDKVKVFGGFFLPYVSKKQKTKIKELKKKKDAKKKIKVNVAILGGGDIVFPIIAAGTILMRFGFKSVNLFGLTLQIPIASLLVMLGAASGLTYLFLTSEKKKFYPAMPFISAGIFVGIGLGYLLEFLGVI
jgi:presenilin-like A22 family membrane protease